MTRRRTTRRVGVAAAVLATTGALALVPPAGAHAADGTPRTIRSYIAIDKCLEVADWRTDDGAPVRIWTCTGGANQQWIRTAYNEFVNVNSGKCLDIPDYSTEPGTQAVQWTCNRGLNQSWHTIHHKWYPEWYAYNGHSGLLLDLFGWDTSDGAPVGQWTSPSVQNFNQRWY
ncbi:RICIN domain-containing protein [Kitasatospora sp. NPDC057500]|uniref:RICIN domain-containing protein n=1 Tax=Kitasatospora sp. NPDC057500 TaxID=3346151 RepID=UPI003682681D